MQVSVESPNQVERRLTITVPVQEVETAFDKRIHRIAQTAELKGFRRGKAPLSFVKQRFGDEARNEALSEVIQASLYEALKKEKLNPINTPQIEPKMLQPNQPLEYVAVFEVIPEINSIQFEDVSVDKPVVNVGGADIDDALDRLRNQRVTWHQVDRASQDKDQVLVNYSAIHEGNFEPENKVKDFSIVLGSKRMIPGFEEGLLGTKAGEEKQLHLSFPQDFFMKEKAGAKVDFTVEIIKVLAPTLPVVDEAFVKALGIVKGGVEELRNEIKTNLDRERDRLVRERVKEQLFNKLLEQNSLEVPGSLIQGEAKRIHDELHPHHQGHDHGHSHEEMEIFNDLAKKRVTLSLLITAYAKKQAIMVDSARVLARIQEIAASYEHPEEVIRWFSTNKEQKSAVESQVLEDQVIEKLLQGANVTEKAVTYQELIAK
ncbi:MAG: trigger factor [Gammaproteobacteria bacterium RIFCSPHIGHO2_12_FULL_42_13]|nr:MAG: trigger factor [Gammaproteobacteria bacterium RIFCSPHIGHO2_12_FULL_42_13]